jgi:nucleotide-binding universal stress UspA family protein
MCERRVIVGMDGSVAAFRALDTAAAEAERRAVALEVLCCVADLDEAGPILRSAAARVRGRHPDLAVVLSPVVGDPVGVLVERSRYAALTVVGTRGLGGVAGLLMHSVSRRLAARAQGPLLVVRGRVIPEDESSASGTVLLGVESDDDTEAALFAFEEAGLRAGHLMVLHTWSYRQVSPGIPGPRAVEPVQEETARQSLTAVAVPGKVVAPLREADPRLVAEIRSVRATPCRTLVAATADADLVVIAAHRRRARIGRQLGPVTEALLHRSRCPVAVVPALGR